MEQLVAAAGHAADYTRETHHGRWSIANVWQTEEVGVGENGRGENGDIEITEVRSAGRGRCVPEVPLANDGGRRAREHAQRCRGASDASAQVANHDREVPRGGKLHIGESQAFIGLTRDAYPVALPLIGERSEAEKG